MGSCLKAGEQLSHSKWEADRFEQHYIFGETEICAQGAGYYTLFGTSWTLAGIETASGDSARRCGKGSVRCTVHVPNMGDEKVV